MLVLGIDTSTRTTAVGLWDEDGLVAEISGKAHVEHSERLLVQIDRLFEFGGRGFDELGGIGAVVGPGSFTGLRVGIATAQGLAESRGIPTVGLSSLEVIAYGPAGCSKASPICSLLVARRGYIYAALYQEDGGPMSVIQPPVTCEPEEIIPWIEKPTVFVGQGYPPHREFFREILGDRIIEPSDPYHRPSGRAVSWLAYRDLTSGRGRDPARLLPEYLGPSTAEINWEKRQAKLKGS